MKTDPLSVLSSRPSCGPQMRCSLTAEYHNWESGFTSPCRGINEGHDMTSAIVYHGRVAVAGHAPLMGKRPATPAAPQRGPPRCFGFAFPPAAPGGGKRQR